MLPAEHFAASTILANQPADRAGGRGVTKRQPRRRQPALQHDHHDTIVRIAAPKREDAYSRIFWLFIAALLGFGSMSVWALLRDRDAAIVIRTKVDHHETEITALKSQSASFATTVSDLRNVARDLGELRTQMAASISDRYTGSQAALDRSAITERLSRVEATGDDLLLFRARVEEWMRTRGGPQSSAKSSALFGSVIP